MLKPIAIGLWMCAVCAPYVAHADIVHIDFAGPISYSSIDDIQIGTSFVGHIEYNSEVLPSHYGFGSIYENDAGLGSMAVNIGGLDYYSDALFSQVIFNGGPCYTDQYHLSCSSINFTIEILSNVFALNLWSYDAGAITDNKLPSYFPKIYDFDRSQFIELRDGAYYAVGSPVFQWYSSSVPDIDQWISMILGFGLLGTVLRQSRTIRTSGIS